VTPDVKSRRSILDQRRFVENTTLAGRSATMTRFAWLSHEFLRQALAPARLYSRSASPNSLLVTSLDTNTCEGLLAGDRPGFPALAPSSRVREIAVN